MTVSRTEYEFVWPTRRGTEGSARTFAGAPHECAQQYLAAAINWQEDRVRGQRIRNDVNCTSIDSSEPPGGTQNPFGRCIQRRGSVPELHPFPTGDESHLVFQFLSGNVPAFVRTEEDPIILLI